MDTVADALAYALLGERFAGVHIVGSLMALGGMPFLRLYEGRRVAVITYVPEAER